MIDFPRRDYVTGSVGLLKPEVNAIDEYFIHPNYSISIFWCGLKIRSGPEYEIAYRQIGF